MKPCLEFTAAGALDKRDRLFLRTSIVLAAQSKSQPKCCQIIDSPHLVMLAATVVQINANTNALITAQT